MLMNNQLRSMVCLNSEGFLVPMELGVWMNILIDNGVQFCGAMNFKTKASESCVLLVNKMGAVLEMTKSVMKYFQRDSSLLKNNKAFGKVFKVNSTFCTVLQLNQWNLNKFILSSKSPKTRN